jgi:hypothetical protein
MEMVTETRRERGPLLRSFERQAAREPAGLSAEVRAQWPSLEVRVTSSSVCRTEAVREYAEEVITERSAPAAGPSIVTGVTAAAVGAVLLLARGAFSDAPDTRIIDAGGRFGPSDRQVATTWAIPLLVIGVPSIAVGWYQLTQVGETTSQRTVDQVSDARESRCDERPENGALAVLGPSGPSSRHDTRDGKALLPPEALRGTFMGLALDGRPVALDAPDAEELEAFRACARALPLPDDAGLQKASTPELILRLEEAQRCTHVAGAGGAEAASRLADALAARAPPRYQTMEEAVRALSPALALAPGSPDAAKLSRGRESLEGVTARVSGTVLQVEGPGAVLLALGPQNLLVETDGDWPEPRPRPGRPLEAVGVLVGRRTVGEVEVPVLRAVFVRAGQ